MMRVSDLKNLINFSFISLTNEDVIVPLPFMEVFINSFRCGNVFRIAVVTSKIFVLHPFEA